MTRPIRPASPIGEVRAARKSVESLAKRPAPVVEATLTVPCFRAYKWNAALQTINNANDGYITFDRWQTSDATKIDSGGWIAGTPDVINSVDFKVRGLWAITIMVKLDPAGTWTGTWGMAMEDEGSTLLDPPGVIFPCGEAPGDNSSGFFSWSHVQSFPPIWAEQTTDTLAPDLPNARWTLSNNGGSNVDILYAMLEIHLLHEFDYEAGAGTIQSQA